MAEQQDTGGQDWRAMWQAMVRQAQIEGRPHMREPRDDVILAADAALQVAETSREEFRQLLAPALLRGDNLAQQLQAAAAALREAETERDEFRIRLAGCEERLRIVFAAYKAWQDKFGVIENALKLPDKPIIIVGGKDG